MTEQRRVAPLARADVNAPRTPHLLVPTLVTNLGSVTSSYRHWLAHVHGAAFPGRPGFAPRRTADKQD